MLTRTPHIKPEEFVIGNLYKRYIHPTNKITKMVLADMCHRTVVLDKNVVLMVVGTAIDKIYNETFVVFLSEDISGKPCEVVIRDTRASRVMFSASFEW